MGTARWRTGLCGAVVAGIVLTGMVAAPAWAKQRVLPPRHLVFVGGGGYHDHAWCVVTLRHAWAQRPDLRFLYTEDLDVLTRLDPVYDAIIIYTTGLTLPGAQKTGLLEFVAAGGGVVGLHSATDTFQQSVPWPEYDRVIGGRFLRHPPRQTFPVTVAKADHLITQGITDFEIYDELYMMETQPDNEVLLTGQLQGQSYPVGWTRSYGQGRVFYLALGHGIEAWENPAWQRLVTQGLEWVLHRETWK